MFGPPWLLHLDVVIAPPRRSHGAPFLSVTTTRSEPLLHVSARTVLFFFMILGQHSQPFCLVGAPNRSLPKAPHRPLLR